MAGIKATRFRDPGPIPVEIADAARRSVARIVAREPGSLAEQVSATAELFDMLGIAATDPESVEPTRGGRAYIQAGRLAAVVDRIEKATGLRRKEIAARAHVHARTLSTMCAPTKRSRQVSREMYTRVLRLAQELGA